MSAARSFKTNPIVRRLPPQVSYRTRRPGKTYLDLNEPAFEGGERCTIVVPMISKGTEVLERTLHQYPLDSVLDLALRERLGEALYCPPENVLITRGSDAALRIVFEAFAFAGTTVGVLDPTYDSVFDMLTRSGARAKRVHRLPCGSALDFPEALLEGPGYDVVYLCNPNNPLGYVLQRKDILREVDALPDTLFIVDEAYVDYTGAYWHTDPQQDVPMTSVSVAPDVATRSNLIVTRSFSKSYGMPGARLGAIAASTEVLDVLRKLVCPTEVPDISKAIGLVSLHPETRTAFGRYFDRVRALRTNAIQHLESIEHEGFLGVIEGPRGVGLFFAIELANERIARLLVEYLDDSCHIVVVRKSFVDHASKRRHIVRCQIGTTEATNKLVEGIMAIFQSFRPAAKRLIKI